MLIILDLFPNTKGRKVIGRSQCGLTKGKSCLTNLKTSYNDMTGSVHMGKAVDVVYLDFSRDFDMVCLYILMDKLMKYSLGKGTVRWIEIWLLGLKGCDQ